MTTLYDIHELEQLCERQRSALDALLQAVDIFIRTPRAPSGPDFVFIPNQALLDLHEIYMQISTYSTMTGSSEK